MKASKASKTSTTSNPSTVSSSANSTAVVQFDDAGFGYPARPPVLTGLTLSAAAGEVVVLVGRSGAGKSTILKLVNRLLLPASGTVRVEGRNTREWDGIRLRRRIGYVLQDVGLFPHMTVEANVGVVPRLERWAPDRIRARTHALLDLVGLPPETFASRWPSELSGGQRQRVGVARALAVDPPILLMDEPFGALDPVTRVELQREFVRIQRQLRTTVLLVTHDMAEAFALADRIGVLDRGALVVCDSPEIVARSRDPRVRLLVETVSRPPEVGGVP
jgi:osmoprotectant transport system ATP-binding protein